MLTDSLNPQNPDSVANATEIDSISNSPANIEAGCEISEMAANEPPAPSTQELIEAAYLRGRNEAIAEKIAISTRDVAKPSEDMAVSADSLEDLFHFRHKIW